MHLLEGLKFVWIHVLIWYWIWDWMIEAMYSCGPPLMDVQEWDDQHELTYSSYVRTRVVILKTCRRRWMIGRNGERRSGISAQAARHDDDDDEVSLVCCVTERRKRDKWIVLSSNMISSEYRTVILTFCDHCIFFTCFCLHLHFSGPSGRSNERMMNSEQQINLKF